MIKGASAITAGILTILPAAAFAAVTPQVHMSATLERSIYPVGQTVPLTVTLRNDASYPMDIGGSAYEISSFQITVTDSAGRLIRRTAYGNRILTPPTSIFANKSVRLEPGKPLQYHFSLAKLFDLSHPGKYYISVRRYLTTRQWTPEFPDEPPNEIALNSGPLPLQIVRNAAQADSRIPAAQAAARNKNQ